MEDIDDEDNLDLDIEEIEEIDLEEVVRELDTSLLKPDEMSTDLLQIFLRDVAKYPLLTADQEIALAKRIKHGDARDARLASDALALHNLRMVVAVAGSYHRNKSLVGVSYMDLIQEGMFGLLRAVEKYDHTKTGKDGRPYRFSTYAMWWVRQAVRRGLADKSRSIRVPMHVIDKLGKISLAENKLRADLGREATAQEIADHLGLKPAVVADVLRGTQEPISLSLPLTDAREEAGESALEDALRDETTPSPHEMVVLGIEKEILSETLNTLSARSLDILEHRYGLNGKPELNLTDIGKIWGITYQRVRQIEMEILTNLRSNADLQILRES